MTDSAGDDLLFAFPWQRVVDRTPREQTNFDGLIAELNASRAREAACFLKSPISLQRQDLLAQEFEHRLVNGLQIIVSLLSLQSRTASPEAAAAVDRGSPPCCVVWTRASAGCICWIIRRAWSSNNTFSSLCKDLSGLLFRG